MRPAQKRRFRLLHRLTGKTDTCVRFHFPDRLTGEGAQACVWSMLCPRRSFAASRPTGKARGLLLATPRLQALGRCSMHVTTCPMGDVPQQQTTKHRGNQI